MASPRLTEADLFAKIDCEGGFYEAFLHYGLNLKDYKLDKKFMVELNDIVTQLRIIDARVAKVMDRLGGTTETTGASEEEE